MKNPKIINNGEPTEFYTDIMLNEMSGLSKTATLFITNCTQLFYMNVNG